MNSSDFQEKKYLNYRRTSDKLKCIHLKSAGVFQAAIFLGSFTAKLALSITSFFISKENYFHPQQIVLLNVVSLSMMY